ncbi:MAG: hypothetical protein JWP10_459, partial [Nocardioidaceae bacterium]|nr:hypothetical protein [Nocardioidaceae bacterium]
NTIVSEFTPESYASSFDTALQQKPDYITFAVTMPLTVIKKQLEKAHEAGIAIFPGGLGPDYKVGGDNIMTGSVVGNKLNIAFSTLMADVVIAEAKASDKVVLVQDPAAPAHVNTRGTIEARLKAAGGKLGTFDVKLADTGTAMPGQIVSYLQSNPDVKYLLFADDTLTSGVPDAIKSAGLPLPKIIGQHPSGQQLKFIQDGDMYASIVADTLGSFWDVGDMMARLSIGAPIPDPEPIGQLLVVKKDNAATAPIGLFEGAPDSYLKAWLLQ